MYVPLFVFQFFSDFDSANLARVETDTASLSSQKSDGSPTRQPTVAETIKSNVEAALDINLEKPPETDRNQRFVVLGWPMAIVAQNISLCLAIDGMKLS